ncbi:MAG: sigma-54-dependent Fis family transcriptional regulator [Acidimicrobiia bacterium]|nr:sigma-54-dependent Fis family transcriptional regulator [Acidimicrobiia bacterium]
MVKLGAFQYLPASSSPRRIGDAILSAAAHRAACTVSPEPIVERWRQFLVGDSTPMQHVVETVRLIGNRRCTVLITGETGTGKEMAARAIHMASNRYSLPLVAVNCSALPENLLEAELFGHVKGAFTGAFQSRIGRFEQAHRGTLFLDEIGDMPMELQAKLLRVLQEREFQRLGSSETIKVDTRVIAASNVDLVERVRQGRFREDLYYRINVVPIQMPPLRDRRSDVPALARHFVEKICRQEDILLKQMTPETLQRLCRHSWPGNVRELENAVEKAVALSGERRQQLYPGDFHLPSHLENRSAAASNTPHVAVPDEGLDFEHIVGTLELSLLEQALRKTGGNKKLAADLLGLKRTTFAAKLKSLESSAALVASHR